MRLGHHRILTAEIMNWTGKVTVGPRSGLAELAKRTEVKRIGVYLLVGPDPDSPTKDRVYVGEGDNGRLRMARNGFRFWRRALW